MFLTLERTWRGENTRCSCRWTSELRSATLSSTSANRSLQQGVSVKQMHPFAVDQVCQTLCFARHAFQQLVSLCAILASPCQFCHILFFAKLFLQYRVIVKQHALHYFQS